MKMKAPRSAVSSTILGHPYTVDETGHIDVVDAQHVEDLKAHGYREPKKYVAPENDPEDDPDEPVKDLFDDMKRAELEEYVEERGGEVVKPVKVKALREQARLLSLQTTEA